jgi:hypothetical protein
MSFLRPGLLLAASALLCLSCATTPARFQPQASWSGGPPTGAPSRFNQSCGAACAAPASPSTGEILAPAVTRTGQVLEKAVEVAEAIQGFIHVTRFLDEAEKKTVEGILKDCVRTANKQVDEELFGKGRTLPDSECEKEPVVQKKLAPSWQRHLGIVKHEAAFECIQRALAEKYPHNFSIEPQLRKDEFGDIVLTDRRLGSLRPDIVIHFTRNKTRIQCIYDLKFPCGYQVANTWDEYVERQMANYAGLGGECPPALVTPVDGILRKQVGG